MPRKNARPQARQRLELLRQRIALSKENNIPLRRSDGSIIRGAGAAAVGKPGWMASAMRRAFGWRL